MTKKRILIYLSVILVFAVACAVQLVPGLMAGAAAGDPAEIGTAKLTDEGDTVFIRTAKFTVDGEDIYAAGFTVANAAQGENPAEGLDLSVLTPITVENPLTGTLDKNIYVCEASSQADIYLGDLKLAEGRRIYTDGSSLNLLGGKLEADSVETTGFIAIGSADVTVNSDLTGFSGIMLFISHSDEENIVGFDTPSSLTVNGSVSNKSRYYDAAIDVANGSTMTVTGDVSTEYPVVIHSSESYGKSAFNVGGSLTVKKSPGWGFQLAYSDSVIGGDILADNWVHLTDNSTLKAKSVKAYLFAATKNSSFDIEGDVTLSDFLDVNEVSEAQNYNIGGNLKCGIFSVSGPKDPKKITIHVGGNIEAGQFYLCGSVLDADGDIKKTSGSVFRFDSSEVEIAGNVKGDNFDLENCDVTIDGDLDASSSGWVYTPVKNSVLHVKGDASAYQLNPMNKSEVTIDGTLTQQGLLSLENGATLTLKSDFSTTTFVGINGESHFIAEKNLTANNSLFSLNGGSELTVANDFTANIDVGVNKASAVTVKGNMLSNTGLINVREGSTLLVEKDFTLSEGNHSFDAQGAGTVCTVNGDFNNNGSGLCNALEAGEWNVLGNFTGNGWVGVLSGGQLNVTGDFSQSNWLSPYDHGVVNIGGNVECGGVMEALNGSSVTIGGDLHAKQIGSISGYYSWEVPSTVKVGGSVVSDEYFNVHDGSTMEIGGDFTYNSNAGRLEGDLTVGGDFNNRASRESVFDDAGLLVTGSLTVGGDVNMNNLILNYNDENTNLSVDGIINAYRKADVIKTVGGDYVLDGVNVTEKHPDADSYFYTVPYNTQTAGLTIDGEDYIINVRNHDKDSFEPLRGGETYNVTYELNGGEFREGATVEYTYYAGVGIDLPAGNITKRVGYLFDGWYDNEPCMGDPLTEIPADSTGDKTFYAAWKQCDHTGSTAQPDCDNSAICTLCGEELPALGHIWNEPDWNWDDVEHPVYSTICSVCKTEQSGEADSVTSNDTPATVEADGYTTYTATVTLGSQEFTDDHVVNDEGSMLEVRKAAFEEYKDDAKEAIDALAEDGDSEQCKALIDSAKDDVDGVEYDESKSLDENKAAVDTAAGIDALEAALEEHRKEYTATFIADGEKVDEVTFTIDTDSITEPEVPAKEGNTGVWEEYTLGAEDITVNAVYTPNEYTITYVIDGNETEVKHNYGASVDKPADPVKDGFNFIGWDEEIPDTMPDENLTITALFEAIPEPEEPTPTEPTPTEPTPTEPTPTEPTPTEPTPTEPTPTEVEPAHEHNYKGEVTTKPTCTEDGVMTYTCECGETYTQAIPKTGHKPGEWEVVTPATTEAAGKEVKKCEVCGEIITEREIAKLAPDTADAEIVSVNLEKLNDYGIANAFGVNPEKLPAGSTVTWYVNGEKAGEGNGFQVENPTEDYTIKAVVTNRDGKVIGETEEVNVKVNNSFFARLYYWLCKLIQKVIDLFNK